MLRGNPHTAALAIGVVASALLTAGYAAGDLAVRPADAEAASRLAGQSFYVEPHSDAAHQADVWRSQGRPQDAAAMDQLAQQPAAEWMADDHDVWGRARSLTQRAASAGKSALLVAYYIPGRDCGGYSSGGASSADAYRGWIGALADGIGDGVATVIVEPDAVAQATTGCIDKSKQAERYELLRYAVRTLASRPHVSVYLDAGNPGWISPSSRLVRPLRRAGVRSADGFALNVSSFYRTATNIRYGQALSDRLGRAHFVIDTSRNGNGASPGQGGAPERWCNPSGRATGRTPTTSTGKARVDAFLWVKGAGKSDGACGQGAPPAGEWWPEYALALVRNGGS
jgi:endoglucanase